MLTLTDKHIHCYSLGRQKNIDCIEMVRISRGVDDATLDREPSIFTVINSNSPLRLDTPMLQGIIEMASHNQPVVMTPFTLAGRDGADHARRCAGTTERRSPGGHRIDARSCGPGAPVVYGGFTSNVDMQSGAPAFGTPEYVRTAMVGGQLARRYHLPYRSSNVCAANAVDAQAAYESVFALWGCVMGGVNMMMHGAGWMEGGLHASLAKMVLDADLLHMVSSMMDPVDRRRRDAGDRCDRRGRRRAGTSSACGHTQDALPQPPSTSRMISDWRNYESWDEAGSPEAAGKANHLAAAFLAAYEPPEMDAARREELEAFVARRVAEGGIATDF